MTDVKCRTGTGRASRVATAVALCGAFWSTEPVLAQESAESVVTVVRGDAVKISGVDNWTIAVHGPTDPLPSAFENTFDLSCVFSTTGTYGLELTSLNGGATLTAKSGAAEMSYIIQVVYYRGGVNALQVRRQTFLTSPATVSNMRGSPSQTCSDDLYNGGNNLGIAAYVTKAAFDAAPSGIYQDVVTVTVRPE